MIISCVNEQNRRVETETVYQFFMFLYTPFKTKHHADTARRGNLDMNNQYKILMIEDESNICSFVEASLSANGFKVLTAGCCKDGMTMFYSHLPDLVILDLGLPDGDGVSLIERIRREHTTPILVLSARTTEQDKVQALDMGANDYITKPFSTAELLARIRAALRSNRLNVSGNAPGRIFKLYDLEIDYDRRIVRNYGKQIKLTPTEYNILSLLSLQSGKVLTYSAIIEEIWGYHDSGSTKKLQVNMANLRKKLGVKPGDNRYIINELGVGYRLQEEGI